MPTIKPETTTVAHESFIDENGIPQQRNGSGPVVDLDILPVWQAFKYLLTEMICEINYWSITFQS